MQRLSTAQLVRACAVRSISKTNDSEILALQGDALLAWLVRRQLVSHPDRSSTVGEISILAHKYVSNATLSRYAYHVKLPIAKNIDFSDHQLGTMVEAAIQLCFETGGLAHATEAVEELTTWADANVSMVDAISSLNEFANKHQIKLGVFVRKRVYRDQPTFTATVWFELKTAPGTRFHETSSKSRVHNSKKNARIEAAQLLLRKLPLLDIDTDPLFLAKRNLEGKQYELTKDVHSTSTDIDRLHKWCASQKLYLTSTFEQGGDKHAPEFICIVKISERSNPTKCYTTQRGAQPSSNKKDASNLVARAVLEIIRRFLYEGVATKGNIGFCRRINI
jgi:dsRNA-specific ribonuclease